MLAGLDWVSNAISVKGASGGSFRDGEFVGRVQRHRFGLDPYYADGDIEFGYNDYTGGWGHADQQRHSHRCLSDRVGRVRYPNRFITFRQALIRTDPGSALMRLFSDQRHCLSEF